MQCTRFCKRVSKKDLHCISDKRTIGSSIHSKRDKHILFRQEVSNHEEISQGGVNGTVTDIKVIMKKAIEFLASGIIVCHNHPSGNLNPSESDTMITKKIKQAGEIM